MFETNKKIFILGLFATLFVAGCDRPYLSGPIETDFNNTTWYLSGSPNLGTIKITGDKFCIDRPLAEKLYTKNRLDLYYQNESCGTFRYYPEERSASFGLAEFATGGTVLREYPKGDYFIAIIVPDGDSKTHEDWLLQRK